MKLIRSLIAAVLTVAATAAVADDYTLTLAPAAPGVLTASFDASVNGIFIDTFDFLPSNFAGHVSASFVGLTPGISFFVASLGDQSLGFFPENGPLDNVSFEADVIGGGVLTIFGASFADPNDFGSAVDGRYRLSLTVTPAVPEPATVALMLAGLAGLALVSQRRRAATRR